MIDPNTLKVTELKAELNARGLSTKGLKKELVARLEEAIATEGTTDAPAESASEPDVAPKETSMDESKDMDTTESTSANTAEEAQKIAQVVEPVAEPKAAPAETDILKAPVPVPADPDSAPTNEIQSTIALEPVVGTPTLSQEGLVDTDITKEGQENDSKKRSRDTDSSTDQHRSASEAHTLEKNAPAKRLKTLEINRNESEKIAAAVKESVEADARRRSAAPSPSPAPMRPVSIASVSTATESATPAPEGSSNQSAPVPKSPTEDRRSGGAVSGRRLDARAIMERQIKLAAMDRQPEGSGKPSAMSPTTSKPTEAIIEEVATEEAAPVATLPAETTRSLAITNFVRPLTVNQVKRKLSEFGEVEVLWMDSIRTHCYVIFKETSSAEKAYSQIKGQIFPKETGRPLEPHFITVEAATRSIAAAEEAQKSGKRPVIYTGKEPIVPKPGAPITIRKDDVEVIFKRNKAEHAQVVQPTELFKMTKTQPALYYKAVKEPPVSVRSSTPSTETTPAVAEAN
ncbi:hypothetical protein BG011_008364 [Mortierella polycephala]|uniref:SAP domain-containing protein n=1 Tax=Mortierella polycephala TaxID=41804 RepID=A0A9P6TWN9_9FUNG|nr:hypothetical protein BG011_008364 [Mortierella polycephala]